MARGIPLTIENRKHIITKYIQGTTPQEIADGMGLDYQTVLKALKSNKSLSESPKNRGRKKGSCHIIDETRVSTFYAENPDIYLDEAVKQLGYKRSSLHDCLKRLGLTRKKSRHFMPKVVQKNS